MTFPLKITVVGMLLLLAACSQYADYLSYADTGALEYGHGSRRRQHPD